MCVQIGCVSVQVGRHGECGANVAGVTNQSCQHKHVQQSEPLSAGLPDGGTSPTHSVGELHKYLRIQHNLGEKMFLGKQISTVVTIYESFINSFSFISFNNICEPMLYVLSQPGGSRLWAASPGSGSPQKSLNRSGSLSSPMCQGGIPAFPGARFDARNRYNCVFCIYTFTRQWYTLKYGWFILGFHSWWTSDPSHGLVPSFCCQLKLN